MKRVITIIIPALLLALASTVASAHPMSPRIDRHQMHQRMHIQRGVRGGSLTRHEAMRLRAGQRHIGRMEWRARSDGRMTQRERMHIRRMQGGQSRAIWRLRHNARRSI